MTAIPLDLIDRVKGRITGIQVTDGPEQIDTCDCCHLAWSASALTYCEEGIFECPLTQTQTPVCS